jgi:hypothetical protein
VVVFPEPVGPVTRMIPLDRERKRSKTERSPGDIPMSGRPRMRLERSRRRSTARSPKAVGTIDTRMSISFPPRRILIRPSCGSLLSAMSSPAMTLMRDTVGACHFRGAVTVG